MPHFFSDRFSKDHIRITLFDYYRAKVSFLLILVLHLLPAFSEYSYIFSLIFIILLTFSYPVKELNVSKDRIEVYILFLLWKFSVVTFTNSTGMAIEQGEDRYYYIVLNDQQKKVRLKKVAVYNSVIIKFRELYTKLNAVYPLVNMNNTPVS